MSTRYDYYTDNFINEGWICPRCKRVNAPWVPSCACKGTNVTVTYTKDTSTTAPTGISYSINPNSYNTYTNPIPDTITPKDTINNLKNHTDLIKDLLEELKEYI